MKKSSVILIASLLVLAIGIAGAIYTGNQSGSSAGDVSVNSDVINSGRNITNLGYEDLDRVKMPDGVASEEKCYEGFRVNFNRENHTPNWVSWELLGSETTGEEKRRDKFWRDGDIAGCAEPGDYSRSGYDKGHLCPAADQKWSADAMNDCFVMTNIVPQDHALNAGAWNTLENKERLWAQRDSALIIVAGPLYSPSDKKRIGTTKVRVPGACFKVIAAPYTNPPRGIAFVYPNMTAPGNMENYVMSIRDLEKLTGYDFLYALPDEIEEIVETTTSFKEWNR